MGALGTDRVKDGAARRRAAAPRPPEAVLDSVSPQSTLAAKVSRRGLAAAGRRAEGLGVDPLSWREGGARREAVGG